MEESIITLVMESVMGESIFKYLVKSSQLSRTSFYKIITFPTSAIRITAYCPS